MEENIKRGDTSSALRDQVLESLTLGDKTPRDIADRTGLNLSTIIHEAEILNGLFITIIPGPPVVTYWLKGKEPKGKIVKKNGQLIIEPLPEADPAAKDLMIVEGNERLAEAAKPAIYDPGVYMRSGGDDLFDLPVDLLIVHPLNVRGKIATNDSSFLGLKESILEVGIQEPLIVTPHENSGKYRVVMGNRRLTAAVEAGLETVPCIVRSYPNHEAEMIVMLVENIQRQDLRPMQEARAFKSLWLKANKDVNAVARQVGLTQQYITVRIRLLKLDPELQAMVDRKELKLTPASLIAALDVDDQKKILPRIMGMTNTQVKAAIEHLQNRKFQSPTPKFRTPRERVTTDDEQFTRSGAMAAIAGLGDAWFHAKHLRESFDDVCLDTCVESKNQTLCHSCPVPRFINSILRRNAKKGDENE